MRKEILGVLAALLALVVTSLPASCDPVVEELVVRRLGGRANVRVVLRNPTRTRQAGPIAIDLYARRDDASTWAKIKTWNDIPNLQPGYKVARDIFEQNSQVLADLAAGGAPFQVRAVVRAPGLKAVVEKTSYYTGPDY